MKIIQTFWSGRANPIQKAFGWPHAEYNLMSWALSCSSLRKYYHDVELYTDKKGHEILVEKMNLPYTKVHVVFDENLCLPNHWAFAKIKTYSLQEEPFIHVDGDIYISKPFPKEFLQAPLVAQNREIGTVYYREMMNRVFDHSGIRIPQFIVNGIREDSIASYNMGVFGGNDLGFIKDYCKRAFAFVEDNHLNDSSCSQSRVDCNLLFEQMFFAAQADMNNKKVAVLRSPMHDEGYTSRDFCNLTNFEDADFFHILGGHKQSQSICYALEKTLSRKYPDIYLRICNLYKDRHPFLFGIKDEQEKSNDYHLPTSFSNELRKNWNKLSTRQLIDMEALSSTFFKFINSSKERRNTFVVQRNPHMEFHILDSPIYTKTAKNEQDKITEIVGLCCVPSISSFGKQIIPVCPLGYRIIQLLDQNSITYGEIKKRLRTCFSEKLRKQPKTLHALFYQEITYLFYHNILTTNTD